MGAARDEQIEELTAEVRELRAVVELLAARLGPALPAQDTKPPRPRPAPTPRLSPEDAARIARAKLLRAGAVEK